MNEPETPAVAPASPPRSSAATISVWTVFTVLIVTSAAAIVGRIMTVESARGGTPMLSANDRSRWCAVRALVDHGTFAIDQVVYRSDGRRDPEWQTIDRVRHVGPDGVEHDYSSKPPLLGCLVAMQYGALKAVTGVSIARHPFYVMRLLLITTNVIPFVIYLVLLGVLIDRLGQTAWGKMLVMAAAAWGTFLSTFAVTLNNHLPAAVSVLLAVYAAMAVFRDGRRQGRYFAVAGFFAAFAVTNELPALSFAALLGTAFLVRAPRQTMLVAVPAAAVVALSFFVTNYVTHQSWRPPYAHRSDGPAAASLPVASVKPLLQAPEVSAELRKALRDAGIETSERAVLADADEPGRWSLWDPEYARRWALVEVGKRLEVRPWDNWYKYEGSYWTPAQKQGVDRGEPNRGIYAFHTLIGHRGIFSLTPFWLLSVPGAAIWLLRGDHSLRSFAFMVILLTFVCMTFYLLRPLEDRNYGGVSCGFRWMFWFIPLWLLCAVPAADALATRRDTRAIGWVLLFVSVASAAYTNLNPWSHSWLFDYWSSLGWLAY